MTRITFDSLPHTDYELPVRLEYEIEDNPHITRIHQLCRYFALALGYQEASVDKYFGPDRSDEAL